MVIRELLQASELPRLDAEVLLSHALDIPREKLLFSYNASVAPSVAAAFSLLAKRRKEGCPIAYLVGEKEFYSLPFFVTPDTLIPRPDTELLVEWAIGKAAGKRVLDICCGTGCIGIATAKNANVASLTLADISEEALSVAQKNAARLGADATFLQLDILKDTIAEPFDLILSNPPYIETEVIATLQKDVRDFEPHLALDGGADGLMFYPVIIEKAVSALADGGWLGLEIGHTQSEAVSRLMEACFTDMEVLCDLGGHTRAVVGRKK